MDSAETPTFSTESPRVTNTELAALSGFSEDTIEYRWKHGQLSPPASDGTFDRVQALAELAAKPKQKGRPRGPRGPRAKAEVAADGVQAEIRYRLARAEREELGAAKLRGDMIEKRVMDRTLGRFFREHRDMAQEIPQQECDALAEAMALDCTPATAKRELERIVRAFLERVSQRAFALAEESAG